MTIRCLECQQLTLRDQPKMANEGFGRCKLEKVSGRFVSYLYQRECDNYARTDEEAVLKRLAWYDQLKMYRRVDK